MNVVAILNKSLTLLQSELIGSVVYLDEWNSECISHTIGVTAFLELGVLNVHSMSTPSRRNVLVAKLLSPDLEEGKQSPPVVVFVSQLLSSVKDQINTILKEHSCTKRLVIFCSYSAAGHFTGTSFDQNAYTQFKTQLESVYTELDVEVRYFPWMWSALTSEAFILTPKLHCLGFGKELAPQLSIPQDARELEIKLLSQALIGLGSHLGCKFDVFTLGSDSLTLGQEVIKMGAPVSLEGHPLDKTAALVLIDRSSDLLSPLLHPDTLLDRLLSLSADTIDSSRLTDLCFQFDEKNKLPFFGNEPKELKSFLQRLMNRTNRDGSMYIRKWIREEIRRSNLASDYRPKAGAPTPQELIKASEVLSKAPRGGSTQSITALCKAAAAALDSEKLGTRWEALVSSERQILAAAEGNREDLVQYLLDLIQTSGKTEAILKVPDLCSLLTLSQYILHRRGPLNPTEEKLILESLIQCCLNLQDSTFINREGPLSDKGGKPGNTSLSRRKAELRGSVNEKWNFIKQLTKQQHSLPEATSVHGGTTSPLVRQLVTRVIENKPISELQRPSTVFHGLLQGATGAGGKLLSKGLGRLGLGRQEEALGGHETVVIFLVGGLSLLELESVHEDLHEHGQNPWKTKIILGGTHLISPMTLLQQIWNLEH